MTDFTGDAEYSEEKKTKLHMMDIDTVMVFYKICSELKVAYDDVDTKERILLELAKNKKIRIWETKRSLKEVITDLGKNYGKIIYIKPKDQQEAK